MKDCMIAAATVRWGGCFVVVDVQADAHVAAPGPTRPAETERESPCRRSAPAATTKHPPGEG